MLLTRFWRGTALALSLFPAIAATSHASARATSYAPPRIVSGPAVNMNPTGATPLAGLLQLSTNKSTQLVVDINDGERYWQLRPAGFRENHDVPIIGMRAGRTHTVTVSLVDLDGQTVGDALSCTTPPLPLDFPPLNVLVSQPPRMEPGVTLFAARGSSGPTGTFTYAIMLDAEGEVIWYYHFLPFEMSDTELMRNGNLLMNSGGRAVEMDLLGNIKTVFSPTGPLPDPPPPGSIIVDTDYFHHEMTELPEGEQGDFLALSVEERVFPNYPNSEVDPTSTDPTARVAGDIIIEFKRDGTIVRELKMLDIFDPYRMVYGSLGPFWSRLYGTGVRDWSHANAVFLDQSDNTYVISLRHQDCVAKIDRDTGDIVWILGDHGRWNAPWDQFLLTPIGSPFEWQYHQHAPEWNLQGHLTMFDNGNNRVLPPTVPPPSNQVYSRAVPFDINAPNMTVAQVWQFGGSGAGWYSGFLGDSDPQPMTGNVMVTDGGRIEGADLWARVVEVTSTQPPKVVFEVQIKEPPIPTRAWRLYRAERYTSCLTLPGLSLAADNRTPSIGDDVVFTVSGGIPGEPAVLLSMEVDGIPFVSHMAASILDGAGSWSLLGTIPNQPDLPGRRLTLRSFSVGPSGGITQSCNLNLDFQ